MAVTLTPQGIDPVQRQALLEKLNAFVAKWQDYQGTEQAGAQSFLNMLLDAYEVSFLPGTIFEQHPILAKPKPEELQGSLFGGKSTTGVSYSLDRMDMYLPKIAVWEMKGPEEKDLRKHHEQVLRYWSVTRTRYMVLCNFHDFWVYDTDQDGGQLQPVLTFRLAELPDHADALLFLRGEEAYFAQRAERVTKDIASHIGHLVRDLVEASPNPDRDRDRVTKFALECVFAMFAEDAGLIPPQTFTAVMEIAHQTGRMDAVYSLYDDFGRVDTFDKNNPQAPYINGSLFDLHHPKLQLTQAQIDALYVAAKQFDWVDVRPEIFGSIFEEALYYKRRHELGAHFTREADINKVIIPTVVEPWRQRIRAIRTPKDAERAVEAMRHYHVLDPACGCGNFLYIVYREMKRLEAALKAKWDEIHRKSARNKAGCPPPPPGQYFTLQQLHGIEIEPFAAQLARVVLWIGEYLAAREHGIADATLPLKNLSDVVRNADALFTEWVRPDGELAIVGNPPYLGVRKMRTELGDEYVERLFARYPHNRAADFVTYWFPQALATLRPGERSGFVTTNSIAQNESREASIDRILAQGGTIVNAWKSYPWPGEAAVHVSIVNWVMGTDEGIKTLDDHVVSAITPRLTDAVDVTGAKALPANKGLSFMGVTPGNAGFVLDDVQRNEILAADPHSAAVIKPFLIGRDINRELDQQPTRWIIDFGMQEREEAEHAIGAFRFVQQEVYPIRKQNKREKDMRRWWGFWRPAPDMREALQFCSHYFCISRVTPHVMFSSAGVSVVPDCQVIAITLEGSYFFGILQSRYHELWAWARCSTFEERLRYTPTSIFETFPFPVMPDGTYNPRVVPDTEAARHVATCAEALYTRRAALCQERQEGLTKLYNAMKAGKLPELQALHDALNDAVTACYGWPEGTWRDDNDVLRRLLSLNLTLAARTADGQGVLGESK